MSNLAPQQQSEVFSMWSD